jgi:alkylated DNA nucleotide flippase Atl1
MAAEGKKDVTPYWRTLKAGGALNEKYPGGVAAQAERLESEGHTIIVDKNGNPKKVKDFEKALIETQGDLSCRRASQSLFPR